MLSPEDAWLRIETCLPDPKTRLADKTSLPRRDAVGRILATSVWATVDVPMADVSAMDGYALSGPVEQGVARVIGTVPAGRPAAFALSPGQAAQIMTGAVMPAGADRVVPVELTAAADAEWVRIVTDTVCGAHIRRRGEVEATGDELLAAGCLLTAGAVSTLASHGIGTVEVVRAPRVAVLTTGDEVVPPDVVPGPGQLRDSNGPFLLAAGHTLSPNLPFEHLGTAGDDRGDLESRVRRGLEFDVLLLTGGVSMGEFDFVEEVLGDLGCEMVFDQVAIQPGKPLVAAVHGGDSRRRWVFGLPGNPASVMVTFWLFVRPVLRRLLGHHDALWHGALRAELAAELPASKGRDRFLPARLEVRGGKLYATPSPPVGSHDAGAYGRGTALVRVPPNRPPAAVGEPCEVLIVA